MAKSKQIHYVDWETTIEQGDNAEDWAQGVIQVDRLLSEKFGKTIRNGNNFRLVGYGSALRGFNGSADFDIGFAGTTGIAYVPTTKEGCNAWRYLYNRWRKQKKLAGTVGQYVRYDDFEVGWSDNFRLNTARNSVMRASGLGDSATEQVVLYGGNVNNDVISLQNTWYDVNPIAEPSQDWLGSTIKEPKFTFKFPKQEILYSSSTFSAHVDTEFTPDAYVGGVATSQMNWLPADNHISHMTGTLFYFFKGVPIDTLSQIGDELKLCITLAYEGWNPIVKKPKVRSRGKKKTGYKANKYRRMGYKRPYRRYKRRT